MYGYGIKTWMHQQVVLNAGVRLPALHVKKYFIPRFGSSDPQGDITASGSDPLNWDQRGVPEGTSASVFQNTSLVIWVVWFGCISVIGVLCLLALSGYFVVVSLSILIAIIGWILVRRALVDYVAESHSFALLIVVMALILGIAVDIVTFSNDIGRMNTVFKLYEQAWVLWGIGTGYLT